jgi:hypothetical protein
LKRGSLPTMIALDRITADENVFASMRRPAFVS